MDPSTAKKIQKRGRTTTSKIVATIPRICPTRVMLSPSGSIRPLRIARRSLEPMIHAIGPVTIVKTPTMAQIPSTRTVDPRCGS